jgi:hypothetical protein
MRSLRKKFKGQAGFALMTEMIVLLTILLCASVVGYSALSSKVIGELGDIGSAVGSLNQSFTLTSTAVGHPGDARHPQDVATCAGSSFTDTQDFCDNDPNCACGIRFCIPPTPEIPHPASIPP